MLRYLLALTLCLNFGHTLPTEQIPIISEPPDEAPTSDPAAALGGRGLNGRFLHITGAIPLSKQACLLS